MIQERTQQETKCTFGNMTGTQCNEPAKWMNQNYVVCCEYHKLVLDAFTWEGRNERKWTEIIDQVTKC